MGTMMMVMVVAVVVVLLSARVNYGAVVGSASAGCSHSPRPQIYREIRGCERGRKKEHLLVYGRKSGEGDSRSRQ